MTVQAAPLPLELAQLIPTSAMSEATLVYGYSRAAPDRVLISMPCACGEPIATPSRALADVQPAIDTHNGSMAHEAWRQRHGIA